MVLGLDNLPWEEERFLTIEEERAGPPCLSKGNGVKVLHTF